VLETQLAQCQPLLEVLNEDGPQLADLTPGEGSSKVDRILARDNKAVAGVTDQVAKRADKLNLQRQKSHEVCHCLSSRFHVKQLPRIWTWSHYSGCCCEVLCKNIYV